MARRLFILYTSVFITVTLLLYTYLYPPQSPPHRYVHRYIQKDTFIKYILLWTDATKEPISYLGSGFDKFKTNRCEFTNCYVAHNVSVLRSVADYDTVVFHGKNLPSAEKLPKTRKVEQKYVYANIESSFNYPVCDKYFNGFFNWTWTYKLDSDLRWSYITVYNLTGQVVAPKIDISWPGMDPVDSKTKTALATKSVAAAWFVSNCRTESVRERFAKEVKKELFRLGLSLHVFGKCGRHVCLRENQQECNERLAKDYYFYFAFENSFSEDYVTEKVLTALQHYTVPVVYGGAKYSRFLPPGSYLNALTLGPRQLARRIARVIDLHQHGDGSEYHDFFRWRNHYTFRLTSKKEDVCKICKLLNDPVAMSKTTVYEDIQRWWNSDNEPTHCENWRNSDLS